MGRVTYEEILERKKKRKNILLPGRECVVLSRDPDFQPMAGATKREDLRRAVEDLQYADDSREIFVIGGEKLFIEALAWAKKVYLTVVKGRYDCDRFFPVEWVDERFIVHNKEETEEAYFLEYVHPATINIPHS